MSIAFEGYWAELVAPFEAILGPMRPAPPLFGGRAALVGVYRREPVWLVLVTDGQGDFSLRLAVSLRDLPIEGAITMGGSAGVGRTGDAAFDRAYSVNVVPDGVAAHALDAPTRLAVHRCSRGRGGSWVFISDGYVSTWGEFRGPPSTAPLRPPSLQEATTLVADLVVIGQRLRGAYDVVRGEIAQIRGEPAAAAWEQQWREARTGRVRRGRVAKGLVAVFVGGCMVVILVITAMGVTWLTRLTGGW